MDLARREADHRGAAPEFVALDIGGGAESPEAQAADPVNPAWICVFGLVGFAISNAFAAITGFRFRAEKTAAPSFAGKGLERERGGGDGNPSSTGVASVYEKQAVPVHIDGSPREQFHPSTPTAGGAKRRRANRRVPGWRDPRKILFAFAALSSVGTLILLYFTLSMGRMTGSQADGE
ncbi:hypothetical protein ACP4OV_019509 [Aristida adscensionis]